MNDIVIPIRRDDKKPPGQPPSDGARPVIRHDPGKLPDNLDQLEAALALLDGDAQLFTYTGRLVRVYPAPDGKQTGVRRPKGAIVVHTVESAHLTELATRAAVHLRFDARSGDYKQIDCPRRVCDAFLSRGSWPGLPQLTGFVEAPTITPDGRLIDRPGYDSETGLFLAFGEIPGYEPPPSKPTRDDAVNAADTLATLVDSFPFVGFEDNAAVIAGIVTALVRRILPSAPMLAVTAPTPGTGKTMLAETAAIIATGRRASVLSLGHDDAEAEKRLAGVLLAGDLCVMLDNVERPLGGDLLCQVTTQPYVRLRPLGGSSVVNVPTHALLLATGNNLAVVGDLKRRTILSRLDAQVERPEQRTFDTNHLDDVFSRRGELIRAALMLPIAYLAAGTPTIDGLPPLGGFEEWDQLVRRPLVWAGLPDPLNASDSLREQDPDLAGMRALLSAWHDVFGDKEVTAAEVLSAGMGSKDLARVPEYPELYDALQVACAEKPNARRLGTWLRIHRNRIVDGLQLEQTKTDPKRKVARWRVRS